MVNALDTEAPDRRDRARADAVQPGGLGQAKLNPFGDLHTLQHLSARLARGLFDLFGCGAAMGQCDVFGQGSADHDRRLTGPGDPGGQVGGVRQARVADLDLAA